MKVVCINVNKTNNHNIPNLPHPDDLLNQQAVRRITRGSMQAAEDKAMEAMFDAITEGRSKEEAETIFFDTYKKVLYGVDKRK